jgi:hypothetical protein
MGKPEGKRPIRRVRHRWEDNIKLYLRLIEWGSVDSIHMIPDRDQWTNLENTVINLRVP